MGFLWLVIVILIVGVIAGWLAGRIMEGHGFGFWTNAGLGILGSLVGSLIFSVLGILTVGIIAMIIKATIGAIIVLAIAHWLGRRRTG